jgi:hypothetical protein
VDIRCPPTPELPPLPLVRLSDVRLRVSGAVLRQVLAKLPKLERLSIQTQAEAEGEEPEVRVWMCAAVEQQLNSSSSSSSSSRHVKEHAC